VVVKTLTLHHQSRIAWERAVCKLPVCPSFLEDLVSMLVLALRRVFSLAISTLSPAPLLPPSRPA
jgi:hypothetical protein